MNRTDKAKFKAEVEMAIKPIMQDLYKRWSMYDAAVIREMFTFLMVERNHKRIIDLTTKRKHRKLKYKKVLSQLKQYQPSKSIDINAKFFKEIENEN